MRTEAPPRSPRTTSAATTRSHFPPAGHCAQDTRQQWSGGDAGNRDPHTAVGGPRWAPKAPHSATTCPQIPTCLRDVKTWAARTAAPDEEPDAPARPPVRGGGHAAASPRSHARGTPRAGGSTGSAGRGLPGPGGGLPVGLASSWGNGRSGLRRRRWLLTVVNKLTTTGPHARNGCIPRCVEDALVKGRGCCSRARGGPPATRGQGPTTWTHGSRDGVCRGTNRTQLGTETRPVRAGVTGNTAVKLRRSATRPHDTRRHLPRGSSGATGPRRAGVAGGACRGPTCGAQCRPG